MRCGLLGQHLGHSFSPAIHAFFGDYDYSLIEIEPQELAFFLRSGAFDGLNVTIPYKKAVLPYLDALSPVAARLGAVNTVVRRADGSLYGHNSDYGGFLSLLTRNGLSVAGKKALVLGSGGAGTTVAAVLRDLGAQVVVISRRCENHYGNLFLHADAHLLVNATPVGMFPDCGASPLSLDAFPQLQAVIDLIYNPLRTRLLLDALERGITAINGLWMLVAQAKESAECFLARPIAAENAEKAYRHVLHEAENIVLIGMPGCGKSTVGAIVAKKSGRKLIDTDLEIARQTQKSPAQIIEREGESAFRALERAVIAGVGSQHGLVIATGGGCVTDAENIHTLRQNGRLYYLQRPLELLATDGRPLSANLETLYAQRTALYYAAADRIIDNSAAPADAAQQILEEAT